MAERSDDYGKKMKSLAKVMTAEEERELSLKIRLARSDMWAALLSNSTVLEAALDTCQTLAEGRSSRQLSIMPSEALELIAATRRYDRRRIKSYESALRRAKAPIVERLADFDSCMDLGLALMKKVRIWAVDQAPDRQENYRAYLKNVELSWKVYCKHRNDFVERNIRLVAMIAKRFVKFGIPYEDLVQEGALGLHRAVGMFDPSMGFKFSTYAAWWIRASIFRHCRNRSRIVRIPINTQEKLERYHAAIRDFEQKGKDADLKKISKYTGISEKSISYISSVALDNCMSTEADIGGVRLGDLLSSEDDHMGKVDTGVDAELVVDLIRTLPDRQQYILYARFGLEGKDGMTLQEIADIFNMSRERIRQIESIAISQLRTMLEIASQ